jgi:hypothetical protein
MVVIVAVDDRATRGTRSGRRLRSRLAARSPDRYHRLPAGPGKRRAGVPRDRGADPDQAAGIRLSWPCATPSKVPSARIRARWTCGPSPGSAGAPSSTPPGRAQLIVLAVRSGIAFLPGTVSQHVIRRARCPVLLVPASPGG